MAQQGSKGRIVAWSDFNGGYEDITWASTSVDIDGGWYIVSVNEGTINKVTDEPGGVIQFDTDTATGDNVALISGPFRPADGGCWMQVRLKVMDDAVANLTDLACFVGFSETMAQDTPVIPATFSTTSMTYAGSGGMVGFVHDSDATDNDWRALAGDGGAASSNADANGTRSNQTMTFNEYYIFEVQIDPDGTARCYIAHDGAGKDGLTLVKTIETAITPGDIFYAVAGILQNRTNTADNIIEFDYAYAEGNRDWSV